MIPLYEIEGCTNKDPEQLDGPEYNDPNYYPDFQKKIKEFKDIIIDKNNKGEGFVVMRVYDGEFIFLRGRKGGNVGKRHCSINLTRKFLKPFKEGCYKVDMISVQLNIRMENFFKKVLPNLEISLPMDIIYGLFVNKWFLKTFKNKIALIGGERKLDVIKNLMNFEEYRNYVCNDKFLDYITVPERHSCDNCDIWIKGIGEQIKNSKAEIFLYGIGISKMAVAYKFKEYKNAIFIDIGCGLSGLAGTCGTDRPYFGNWVNYRMKNYDYTGMDPMDFNNDNVKFLD